MAEWIVAREPKGLGSSVETVRQMLAATGNYEGGAHNPHRDPATGKLAPKPENLNVNNIHIEGAERPAAPLSEILTPGRILSEADVLALSERLEPAWRARQRRLDARDAAIRVAAALFLGLRPTATATAVSRALDRHLGGRDTPDSELFERIATLNGGAGISHRQVFDILRADRRIHAEKT
jgi:hypothetical protein